MKKLSLILFTASLGWIVQTAEAQTLDTTKNKVEVKKKVRERANGTTVTKVKMTGKGTPTAINEPASNATSSPSQAKPATPPVVVTPPASPQVVVVRDPVSPTPRTKTTQVTTTTETKPVAVKAATTHRVTASRTTARKPARAVRTSTRTTVAAPVVPAKTTTTTTRVEKTE